MVAGLRVDPQVMHGFSDALRGAAEDLRNRLTDLDGDVSAVLAGWHGASGSAYASAWELWHRGAGEVQLGLSILAEALARAGNGYQQNEAAARQAVRAVADV
ncbi:WXG100 family type VII secretion target [Mycobacterium szulgai]|nr:WXG100 family type VII secretion target [Mycobacterium szulgai]MCV7075589.1 WXG100 family type VII secretion target [Mycobacterium szulgai]